MKRVDLTWDISRVFLLSTKESWIAMPLSILPDVYTKLLMHLRAGYPHEAAGLLLGRADGARQEAVAAVLLANRFDAAEQYHRFLITAEDMLAGENEAEKLGLDVIGIFHSHPDCPAIASDYDRERALPWYAYLIVSLQGGEPIEARVWRLQDDRSRFVEDVLLEAGTSAQN